jgi:hypothetical protein
MPPNRRLPLLLLLAIVSSALGACASAPAPVAMDDPDTLRAERDEWRGARGGAVMLRRHIKTLVDTAQTQESAESHVSVHLSQVRYAGTPAAETVRFSGPPGAILRSVRARVLTSTEVTAVRTVAERRLGAKSAVDPGRVVWELDFPPLPLGGILEVVAALDVPGTVTNDARWLAVTGMATGELLLSWDLPSDAEGRLGVVGAAHRTVATEADGRRVYALYLKDLPPRGEDAAYARYVTEQAEPRGYLQRFAGTWRQATAGYEAGLVAPSEALRGGYAAPIVADDADLRARVTRAHLWVRDRIQRPDALETPWDAARPLLGPIQDNDLTGTDKVHLLHWLLDAAGVEHRLAVARTALWPRIDPAAPAPAVFDAALVWVPALDLWLDPACRTCDPGAVRLDLTGGQAIALPADSPPVELP